MTMIQIKNHGLAFSTTDKKKTFLLIQSIPTGFYTFIGPGAENGGRSS